APHRRGLGEGFIRVFKSALVLFIEDATRELWKFPSATGNAQSLAEQSPLLCWRNLFDPFFQGYGHCVTHSLPDRLANVCPYRQFMCAIAQSHERTPKGVPIDSAPDLYQAAGSKELD